MKMFKNIAIATTLSVAMISPSVGAIEIDEKDFGPTYGSMVADATVGKPLQALAVVGGAAAWLISWPFNKLSGDVDNATEKLINEPVNALYRCFGCTPEEDKYYKSLGGNNNQVRVVVNGPSEVLISTNQEVVVAAP